MNKNALITGASRGIGRAIAIEFARAGYDLTLCCIKNIESLEHLAKDLADTYRVKCVAYRADVSDPAAVKELFAKIDPPSVLINNAGISYVGLVTDMSDEDWMKTLNTNLSSVFYMCRAAIPHMLSEFSGKIINVSSVWGESGASMEVAYSASKGGLDAFTKALAKELAPSGISVNAVACGLIDTDMNSRLSDEELAEVVADIPADRIGKPAEVASVILSLAESTNYLTGQIIKVDGGWM
ncbi:MAG: SDR family oxidoreductase [Lachnospiraceae bacterium]|nr:SDR family oxidoreductase [Lachnospiraceae bacterium]